jgi:DNA-binding transcriptional regulator LsrR (DeoR family)
MISRTQQKPLVAMNEQENNVTAHDVAKTFYGLRDADRRWKTVIDLLGLNPSSMRACEKRLREKLHEHEQKNLVKHIVLKEDEHYLPREPKLEEEIRKCFALRAVVVVDISSLRRPSNPSPSVESKREWHDYEEAIHQRLGIWAGRLVSAILRPRDVLGTGGGRGLYHTAQNVFSTIATRQCGNVVSLTGQIGSDPDVGRQDANPHFVDADLIAGRLQWEFQPEGMALPVGRPITEHQKGLPAIKEVTVALTGIGALTEGHRFKKYKHLERLKAVEQLLRRINELAEAVEATHQKQSTSFYHPVGDICNYCFFVPQLREKTKEEKELETLLQKLNDKFLNTTPRDLAAIAKRGSVVAVAGGPHKAGAIGYVLREGKGVPWITHLVTDHEVAQEILTQESKVNSESSSR